MKLHWIAVALLLATMSRATANPIPTPTWEYSVTISPGPGGFVWNTPAGGPVTTTTFDFTPQWTPAIPNWGPVPPLAPGESSAESLLLGGVRVVTAGPTPPSFSETGQGAFTLAMSIRDPSGATGTLTFTGTLNMFYGSPPPWLGTADTASTIANFNQPRTQSIVVGSNQYTVFLTLEEGVSENGYAGGFYAFATQTPVIPEPGTLALAGIGIGLVGFGLRRRSLPPSFTSPSR